MTEMERLKEEARATAAARGHKLGKFKEAVITAAQGPKRPRESLVAECQACGAIVGIDPAPVPGEPKIFGDAIIQVCLAPEWEGHETA